MLLSTTIVTVLMLVCTKALDQTQKTWLSSRSKVEQFREARLAFELVTRSLSQATLNTYWDYYYQETASNAPPADAPAPPRSYIRHSELQFQSGFGAQLLGAPSSAALNPGHALFFQAPLGLSHENPGLGNLLNARGYYVEFSSDEDNRPAFVIERGLPINWRYRLMEYRPPAESTVNASQPHQGNTIYVKPTEWFRQDITTASRVVADNIILLLVSPRISDEAATTTGRHPAWIAPYYSYNSLDSDNSTPEVDPVKINALGKAEQGTQHQLPPLVDITMVALDEPSARDWIEKRPSSTADFLTEAGAPFTTASQYHTDLESLKTWLTTQRLNFRVFTSTVALRNARWDQR
jgi:uncharacterized protein (TIGR02599 family)